MRKASRMKTALFLTLLLLVVGCADSEPNGVSTSARGPAKMANKLVIVAPATGSTITPSTNFTIACLQVLNSSVGEQPPPRLPSGQVVVEYEQSTNVWVQAPTGAFGGAPIRAPRRTGVSTLIPSSVSFDIDETTPGAPPGPVQVAPGAKNIRIRLVHIADGPGGAWLTSSPVTWNPVSSDTLPELGQVSLEGAAGVVCLSEASGAVSIPKRSGVVHLRPVSGKAELVAAMGAVGFPLAAGEASLPLSAGVAGLGAPKGKVNIPKAAGVAGLNEQKGEVDLPPRKGVAGV